MRVISQDGTIDVPYEKVAIQRCGNRIYFLNKNLISIEQSITDMQIAHYSSSVKAEKAMEMLREAYAGLSIIMQNADISEDVAKAFEKWKKQGICVRTANEEPPKIECINNVYFQFPADEDVEV